MRTLVIALALTALHFAAAAATTPTVARSVPVIYSTDLYHPHQDPDDHFDLATLFAIPEFDIRAVVFDLGPIGKDRPGLPALKQLMSITGRRVPYALGLTQNLLSPADRAGTQPAESQAGVDLILRVLEESEEPVTVITAGSLRDVAAAYNRRPDLLRDKVARVYINIGHSGGGEEWNVKLDPHAYVRIMRSDLPVYWAPCFGADGYFTLWKFRHGEVLDGAPPALQNYFIYALTKLSAEEHDPVEWLSTSPPAETRARLWKLERRMWCTGPFLHAAGRKPETCTFENRKVQIGAAGVTKIMSEGDGIEHHVFHRADEAAYTREMTDALRDLFSGMKPAR